MGVQQYFRRNIKLGSDNRFIFIIDTTKTSSGSSASNQFSLPLRITGDYDFTVEWGDSTFDTITEWDATEKTHTYATSGVYTVIITGKIIEFRFNNSLDRLKLIEIQNWGSLIIQHTAGGSAGSFNGCSNMDVTATDVPVFSGTAGQFTFKSCSSLVWNSAVNNLNVSNFTIFLDFFDNCALFNQPINNLDLSNSTDNRNFLRLTAYNQTLDGLVLKGNCESFLRLASNFNQSLAGVDVSGATSLARLLENTAFSNENYDPTLISWASQSLQSNVSFHAGAAKYSAGAPTTARAALTGSPNNWTITDGGQV